ncbi:MAG TPA: hypothetical protein VK183_03625 [Flavobacterium sp.]|nr:hypothetical protein [Flavobacterium sp.]
MVLILVSWCIMAAFFGVWGTAVSKWLSVSPPSGGVFFLGMMTQTLVLTIVVFFAPLNGMIFLANALLTSVLAYTVRDELQKTGRELWHSFQNFSHFDKVLLGLATLAALWKSAQLPFLIDNDTYYLQTIKWLHEHGLVKGLANLNVAFGQTSPWQILQAGFDLPFTGWPLNDLNGLAFVIFVFILLGLTDKVSSRYILLFSTLLLQFVTAPSPDLPVILILVLAFFAYTDRAPGWWAVLVVYAIFLKVTALPFALLLVVALLRRTLPLRFAVGIAAPCAVVWIAKNIWLSGYPLFPSTGVAFDFDWTVPEPVAASLGDMIRNHEFMGEAGFRSFGWLDRLDLWWRMDGLDRLFNIGMLALFPLALVLKGKNSSFRLLWTVCLLHFGFIIVVSPQYRFFLPEFVFLGTLVAAELTDRLRLPERLQQTVLVGALVLPFVLPLALGNRPLTGNGKMALNDSYALRLILWPSPITRLPDLTFETERVGNLRYNTPPKDAYFHTTGDGPLPCTNRRILERNARKYGVVPQLRTANPGDGFRSLPADEWDKTN